jgi:hypothetical protein
MTAGRTTADKTVDGMPASRWAARTAGVLRESRAGLFVIALLVGAGSGLGAVAFRYLIYFFTWLATGIRSSASRGMWAARTWRFSGWDSSS